MDRMACVDIRSLPLQVLLRKRPEWREQAVAVVDRDTPTGTILYVNKRGRARRILPGLRYGAGLSLCRELRGGTVSPVDIEDAVTFITARLWQFSPRVEPSPFEPGVFWLDASGLMHVCASLAEWAEAIRADLRAAEFHAVAAVGFTRFGSYAGARSHVDGVVFADAEEESAALRATPIECLSVDPYLRDTLARLGITRLGGFMELPRDAIRKRFGPDAEALHEMAAGAHWRPMQPREFVEPIERVVTLEYPESNADRLLFLVARELSVMLAALAERHEALRALHIAFELGDGNEQACELMPASPTLDARQILTLLRLRLERMTLTAGVDELKLRAEGERASQRQLELFNDAAGRNLDAANEAIAKLRAFLDQDAIVRARIREGHLPEAQFQWEPARRLRAPQPAEGRAAPLAKRIYSPALELPPRPRLEPDGWMIKGYADEPVSELRGPYVVSGGWWVQDEMERSYHYALTRSGRCFWLYHDKKRRRWYLHGEVE